MSQQHQDKAASQQQQSQSIPASVALSNRTSAHTPSAAGTVLEVDNNMGGTILIRIQNMSSTCNLGTRLDLKKIAMKCRNTEFNPRRFAAAIMRLREPRATALMFASGKMCITGTKSTGNSMLASKKFAYILEKIGFKCKEHIDFKVQNIVGTADVGFPIRLEGLVHQHSNFATYEPELFPGLIYRLVEPQVVLLIFVSGKIVLTGAKTEKSISAALTKIYPVLVLFKKQNIMPIPGVALPSVASTKESSIPSNVTDAQKVQGVEPLEMEEV